MRGIGSFLLGIVALVLLAGIGVAIYNAGLQQGIAQTVELPGSVPYYAYGGHWGGFGIFGLIFPILFLFLIFGLIRAALGGGRGRWGHPGYGYGPGRWGSGPWMADRDSRIAEWHRQLHEAEGATGGSGRARSGESGPGPSPSDRPS